MLDIHNTAKTILSEAETRLQDLSIQAMRSADYDASRRLTDLAEDVRLLASRLQSEESPFCPEVNGDAATAAATGETATAAGSARATVPPPFRGPGGPASKAGSNGARDAAPTDRSIMPTAHAATGAIRTTAPVAYRATARGASRAARRRAPAKGEYPKFFRQGDTLVKVSWSKKERAEYQHKAPRRAVDLLAAAIARKAARTGRFTTEELFPLKDPQDGAEVLSYQAYVALAWLKAGGIVKQKGKGGYLVKAASEVQERIKSFWLTIPET